MVSFPEGNAQLDAQDRAPMSVQERMREQIRLRQQQNNGSVQESPAETPQVAPEASPVPPTVNPDGSPIVK